MSRPLSAAREYVLVLLLGAVGAGLVLLSVRQGWARVVTPARGALPASSVSVRGQDLVPAAEAVALAALAGLVAVIATKGRPRRLVGAVVAVFGVVIAVAVTVHLSAADVRAAALGTVSPAGSATAGGTPGAGPAGLPGLGSAGHVVAVSFPWRGVAVLGALAVIAAGVLVTWRGGRWPTMSSRYDAPSPVQPARGSGTASLWESLSRGDDPTDAGADAWGRDTGRGTRAGGQAAGTGEPEAKARGGGAGTAGA